MFKDLHTSGKIVAATLFGVGILGFALWKSPLLSNMTGDRTLTKAESEQAEGTEDFTLDSDNDGVRDWEELLLGTDPHNPDTNGDGVSDGEEVRAAREAFAQGVASSTENGEGLNTTDLLAREIFGTYIQSKQQGAYDPQAFDFLISQSTNSQFSQRIRAPHTIDDIKTTSDVSEKRTLQYEEEFQASILPVTAIGEYELTTYGRAIERSDEAEFSKLQRAAGIYNDIAAHLLTLTVPEDAAQPHLDVINAFAILSEVLEGMGANPEDPILTFVATRNFIEAEDAVRTAYSQIDIYFTLKENRS